jgi:hypothetical protein
VAYGVLMTCDCGTTAPRRGATAAGWRLIGGGWTCPVCVAGLTAWLAAATLVANGWAP